jgi:hypothetical protein
MSLASPRFEYWSELHRYSDQLQFADRMFPRFRFLLDGWLGVRYQEDFGLAAAAYEVAEQRLPACECRCDSGTYNLSMRAAKTAGFRRVAHPNDAEPYCKVS